MGQKYYIFLGQFIFSSKSNCCLIKYSNLIENRKKECIFEELKIWSKNHNFSP
jgi:hypothetical protein